MAARPLFPLALALCAAFAGVARAASPVPPFPADRVAVGEGVSDTFKGLRQDLAHFESALGVDYRVCVVRYSDPQDRPGREHSASAVKYADQVFEAWRPQLDARRSLVIVLALENRGVAIHPGSDWARLGFEQGAITRAIDQSTFAVFARSGDYAGAISRLVEAVDLVLVLSKDAHTRRKAELEERHQRLEDERSHFVRRLTDDQALNTAPAARRGLLDCQRALEEAGEALRKVAVHLSVGDLVPADALLASAVGLLDVAKTTREDALAAQQLHEELRKRAPARLGEVAVRLRALQDAPALWDAPFDVEPVKALLARAAAQLEAARVLERDADLARAVREADAAAGLLDDAERVFQEAWRWHFLKTRVLPGVAAGLALLAALALLTFHAMMRRARRGELERHTDLWRRRAAALRERLEALCDACPLLLEDPALPARLEGESLEAFRPVAAAVDGLRLGLAAARERLDAVEARAARAPWLGWRTWVECVEQLLAREIAFGGALPPPASFQGQLLLPGAAPELAGPAGALFDGLEQLAGKARRLAPPLEELIATLPAQLAELARRLREARAGLPQESVGFRAEFDTLDEELASAQERARRDPVGTIEAVGGLDAHLDKLELRLGRARQALRVAAELDGEVAAIQARIDELRQGGLRLREPGFEPEAALERARELAGRARDAAATADDKACEEHAAHARRLVEEVRARAETALRAREALAPRIESLRQERAALAERLPRTRELLAELQREHADTALWPALDNAEEAEAALAHAGLCLDQAAAAGTPEEQRYLAGEELVARAARILRDVTELFDEVPQKQEELVEARREAERALRDGRDALRGVERDLRESDAHASVGALRQREALGTLLAEEQSRQQEPRPDWLVRQRRWTTLAEGAAALAEQLARERAAREETESLANTLEQRFAALRAKLEASEDDRASVNHRADALADELSETLAGLDAERQDWPARLSELRVLDGRLRALEDDVRDELQLAEAARRAVTRAVAAVSAVRGVNTREAWDELNAARAELARQRYEQAQGLAERAERELVKAEERERRAQEERERYRAAAALNPRPRSTFGSSWASSFQSSSSYASTPSFGSTPSTNSYSSYDSSSSGSSYGSSSSGSSYDSSSGSSSYDSSSGSSSYESSSGGSSW
ncbi:MAG: TPM domain-containing protein [Planctomycetota bacterium]